MKTDLYTRAVLTGILICLVWLCVAVTPIGTPLTAQAPQAAVPVQDVRIVGVKQPEMTRPAAGSGPPRPVSGDWDSLPTFTAPQTQVPAVR